MSITSVSTPSPDPRLAGAAAPSASSPRATPSATENPAPSPEAAIAAPSAPGSTAQAGTEPQPPGAIEQVEQALGEVRKALTPVAQDLLFSIDEDTGKTVVKVVDAATDEVIRQIPSEEIIAIAKALDKLQGLLLQQKA